MKWGHRVNAPKVLRAVLVADNQDGNFGFILDRVDAVGRMFIVFFDVGTEALERRFPVMSVPVERARIVGKPTLGRPGAPRGHGSGPCWLFVWHNQKQSLWRSRDHNSDRLRGHCRH